MGSSPLYLAIVVVWILVLVPMLLRRDAADPSAGRFRRNSAKGDDVDDVSLVDEDDPDEVGDVDDTVHLADHEPVDESAAEPELPRRQDAVPAARDGSAADHGAALDDEDGEDEDDAPPAVHAGPVPRLSRARVIARRRRRTSGLTLLLVATVVAVALGLGPWWVLLPPVMLLFGHLALLREAAKVDAERRAVEMVRRRRREAAGRMAAEAEAAREAEIIELASRRNQVYDQYADAHLRAAGD
ncbi:divisome protein SepX/GlpR [Nocardiopsis ansamitocini]|uniref:Uncharacterized protein n=1 Tax=Nocardiopsis ansamitocini TaxID=1670832 RepID=A0A9W6P4N2_9ACTN|nr:hypothetical protein [Nocardiopsis ansamitocini]GLU46943.1 hypothetical protein Nans01_12940 [Nocardiopsis ansamitocini]